jgi:hypothetical protein
LENSLKKKEEDEFMEGHHPAEGLDCEILKKDPEGKGFIETPFPKG